MAASYLYPSEKICKFTASIYIREGKYTAMNETQIAPAGALAIYDCEKDAVRVKLSSFKRETGVAEYHLLLSVTDASLSFDSQLAAVRQTYVAVSRTHLQPGAVAVFRRYFLSDAVNQADRVLQFDRQWPICALSIVQQPPVNGSCIALWVYWQTSMETKVHGTGLFEAAHNGYSHLWAGGMFNQAANSEFQTRLLLNDYILMLCRQGVTLGNDCIRTWFFVQNVKENYPGVVKARTEVFLTQNLTEKTHYIASTCIEGRYVYPAVLAQLDAYAVKGLHTGQMRFLHASTHLNPTYEYGVTFERGTAVVYGDRTHIFISGTASLDNRGEICHAGDVVKQTARVVENISALLREGGASLRDVVQMIIYLRHREDASGISCYIEKFYPSLPYLMVLAPGYRPGWLVEIECMAITPAGDPGYSCL